MKERIYKGRGSEEITEIIQNSGHSLQGHIQRANGDHVADVEFDVVNGELYLTVNGREYTSITNALHEMAPDVATHAADGSEGSGNVANNVIGNYAILKHVIFGSKSMYDLLGGQPQQQRRIRSGTVRRVKTPARPDPSQTPAQNNLYNWFRRDDIVRIARESGGPEQFQARIKTMTVRSFADEFGLTI